MNSGDADGKLKTLIVRRCFNVVVFKKINKV